MSNEKSNGQMVELTGAERAQLQMAIYGRIELLWRLRKRVGRGQGTRDDIRYCLGALRKIEPFYGRSRAEKIARAKVVAAARTMKEAA